MQTYQRLKRKEGRRDQCGALHRRHAGAAHHLHGGDAGDHAKQGVKVDLPQAESEQLPEDSKPPFIVSVNTESEYVIKAGEADDEAGAERHTRGDAAIHHREGHGATWPSTRTPRGGGR